MKLLKRDFSGELKEYKMKQTETIPAVPLVVLTVICSFLHRSGCRVFTKLE